MKNALRPSPVAMYSRKSYKASTILLSAILGLGLTSPLVYSATKTWSTTAADGNWTTGANWGGSAPSPTGDTLSFGTQTTGATALTVNAATWGSSAANNTTNSLNGITFTTGASAYTITLSNSLSFTNNAAITLNSGVANDETFNGGTIYIGTGTSSPTVSLVNNGTGKLTINSALAGGASGSANDNIAITGTGNIELNGNISNGNGTTVTLTKSGTGMLSLAGTNTYTGATTINGGTVTLSGSSSGSAITVNGGTYNLTGTQSGGNIIVNGNNTTSGAAGAMTQSTTGVISGSGTLTLNSSLAAGGTSGSATLAGNNTTTGSITVGSLSNVTTNPYNIGTLQGANLTLSGANNSGSTQTIAVNPNSTLTLDFSATGAPATNILNTTNRNTSINLVGSTLQIIGKNGATNSQQLTTTNGIVPVANTASQVVLQQNGASGLSLDVGSINRGSSATIDIVFPTTGTVSSTNTATNGLASASGLAWGTANNGTTLLGANGTTLSAYTGWQTGLGNYTTGNNVDVTNGDSVSGVTVGTLRFNGGNVGLTNAGTSNLGGGTVLVTAGTNASINGGIIKSTTSTANELLIINNGALAFGSAIATNNAADKVTVISTKGQTGNATFTGNNTIGTGGLAVNNTNATFSGNNTINGAVTVGNNGVLILSGNNTTSSNFGWSNQGGGTLVLGGAGALGSGVLQNGANSTSNVVKFASDSVVTSGAATLNYTVGNGVSTQTFILDRASAGAGVDETFGTSYLGQQQTLNFLLGSNVTSGTPTVAFGATTGGIAGNSTTAATLNANGVNVTLASYANVAATGAARSSTLVLSGTSTGNEITGVAADGGGTVNTLNITKNGTGTWALKGNNTFTGATTINGGTLVLDYGTNNTSKLSSTGALTLSGGTLQLKGGSTAQAVASTTFNTGQSAITQNGGTSTVALGAITSTAGAADFTSGVATTTTVNGANGLLGGLAKYTVGGADWAVSGASGTNPITALASYTALAIASGGNNTTNYSLAGSNGTPVTGALTLGTLKINATGTGQSLALGANQLTLGSTAGTAGLLFTGSNDYTISGTNKIAAAANPLIIQDWSTGTLTFAIPVNSNIEKYGTGKLVLAANASASISTGIFAGTLQVSSDAQLSNATTNTLTINGSYGNGSAFVANTAGGSFAVTRPIALGAQGGNYIDVIGGNTLTLSGVISGTQATVANNIVTFGGASAVDATNNATTNGTIVLSGANTYSGGTTFAGGTVNLGIAEAAGGSGPLGSGGTLTFKGGTLQYSASNQFDYSSRFSQVANQSFKIDTNGQNVAFAYGLAGASSSLNKSGTGTLTFNGVNSYTGGTIVSAGTLATGSSGTFGAGNVTVASAGSLIFGNNSSILDSATLTFSSSSSGTIALNFSGSETLAGVTDSVSSTFLNAGTYDANTLNSLFGTNVFTGIGSLTVSAIPEPSTFAALAGLGILGYAAGRRRRRAA